jgi:hypothetical protein
MPHTDSVVYVPEYVFLKAVISAVSDPDLAISVDLEREEQEKNGRRKTTFCLSLIFNPPSPTLSYWTVRAFLLLISLYPHFLKIILYFVNNLFVSKQESCSSQIHSP